MKKRIYKKILECLLSVTVGLGISAVFNHWFLYDSPIFLNLLSSTFYMGTCYLGLQALKEEYIENKPELKEKLKFFLDFEKNNKKTPKKSKKKKFVKIKTKSRHVAKENISYEETKEIKDYYALIGYYIEKSDLVYVNSNTYIEINCFLNFVRNNYYDELSCFKLEEKIIPLLLEQIVLKFKYQQDNIKNYLSLEFCSDETIESVIDSCFFLREGLKEKIKAQYMSFRRENQNLIQEKKHNIESSACYSCLSDLELFKKLVDSINAGFKDSNVFDGTFDFNKIAWNFSFLKDLMLAIFESCGIEFFGYENMEKKVLDLLSDLIIEISAYAILNNKYQIGPIEMLNSLKNWEGILSFDVKIKVINKLCQKYGIENHLYGKTFLKEEIYNSQNNIIQLPVYNKLK